MGLVGEKTLPVATGNEGRDLFQEGLRLGLHVFLVRHIHDVANFFLRDALVVVKLSLVASLVQSLHVKVHIKVTGNHSYGVEHF